MFPIVIDEFLISKIGIQLFINRAYFFMHGPDFLCFNNCRMTHRTIVLSALVSKFLPVTKSFCWKRRFSCWSSKKPTRLAECSIEFFAILYPGELRIPMNTKMSTGLVFWEDNKRLPRFLTFFGQITHSHKWWLCISVWVVLKLGVELEVQESEVEGDSTWRLVKNRLYSSSSKVATWSSTSVRFLLKYAETLLCCSLLLI